MVVDFESQYISKKLHFAYKHLIHEMSSMVDIIIIIVASSNPFFSNCRGLELTLEILEK
jgi:hypothetical protein